MLAWNEQSILSEIGISLEDVYLDNTDNLRIKVKRISTLDGLYTYTTGYKMNDAYVINNSAYLVRIKGKGKDVVGECSGIMADHDLKFGSLSDEIVGIKHDTCVSIDIANLHEDGFDDYRIVIVSKHSAEFVGRVDTITVIKDGGCIAQAVQDYCTERVPTSIFRVKLARLWHKFRRYSKKHLWVSYALMGTAICAIIALAFVIASVIPDPTMPTSTPNDSWATETSQESTVTTGHLHKIPPEFGFEETSSSVETTLVPKSSNPEDYLTTPSDDYVIAQSVNGNELTISGIIVDGLDNDASIPGQPGYDIVVTVRPGVEPGDKIQYRVLPVSPQRSGAIQEWDATHN
ncbi:hypothetical protein FWF48_02200 [Candidatus Saccharibacteria bacterium]|nr:hypothetical protein [Candidatus Saccharibacteria bacterium]